MRKISTNTIKKAIAKLCSQANIHLRPDVLRQLKAAHRLETNSRARMLLKAIIDNAAAAKRETLAICQDTGLPVVFVEIGQDVCVTGGSLDTTIIQGVVLGYKKAHLRNSLISDPIRRGKPGFGPPVIHYRIVPGEKLKLAVLPKGFGCENKSAAKMFNPTADFNLVKDFIIDAVRRAGPDACPPFVVGVGIGGTQDYACFLAKKALLKKIIISENRKPRTENRLAQELLKEINKLNIGPMGLGGRTTALAVSVETSPTHIAGLPVAVNISCHALRSATKTL